MTYPHVISESDRLRVRLWKICDDVIRPLMKQTLIWVIPDWDQTIGILTYLSQKNVDLNKLKKKLYPKQMDALHNDPTGRNWDATLIYLLLRFCRGLSDKDDNAWSSNSCKEPECFITSIKDVRNALAHETVKLSQKNFYDKTEEIRDLMKLILVSIGKSHPHISQKDIDTSVSRYNNVINDIRDANFAPESFEEYKKELYFSVQTSFIKEKGLPILRNLLLRITTLTPLSLIMRGEARQIPVNNIFTEMQLEDCGKREQVLTENILEIASNTNRGDIILLKGHAGVGKTTLVKKIVSDWVKKDTFIKGLSYFDLLFYAEFRGYIETFQQLLEYSLGDVHQLFKDRDLVKVALGLRNLVILDGYDEINSRSSKLFQGILSFNKYHRNLTVIVTTRPEAEKKLNVYLDSLDINAVHIRLVGIRADKKVEFVSRYFQSLTQNSQPLQGLDGLLRYFTKTEHKMSVVWELPYNLSLVTILWMYKPDVINRITTEAELYWQIFLLSISKLEERLQSNQSTSHLELSVLQSKTKQFLEELSWESLVSLKEDHINLTQSAYQKLTELCHRLGVPIEELAGSFLKKVITLQDSCYSFPHKGYMEFMGAYSLYMQVTRQCFDQVSLQGWTDELSQTSIPAHLKRKLLDELRTEATENPTLTGILKRLHGGSLPKSLNKYQNLLIQALSIFHVGEEEVPEEVKIETLKLLEKSGLRGRDPWLKVLHNLKCDGISARWIAESHNLFEEKTTINDFSFDAYIALLSAMEDPLVNRYRMTIKIDLYHTPPGLEVLSSHQLKPITMIFRDLFEGLSTLKETETDSIKNMLGNCEEYKGPWSPNFEEIPGSMRDLHVRLPDQPTADSFFTALAKAKRIAFLVICLSVDIDTVSQPIPLERIPLVSLYVPDVKEEDIEKVGRILRALQPQEGSFNLLRFPRCSLRSQQAIHRFLDSLSGVQVKGSIGFPVESRPDDEASCDQMSRKAEALTGCSFGIKWWTDEYMFEP